MKKLFGLFITVAAVFAMTLVVFAASYSSAWYKSGNNWYIRDRYGNTIRNAWVCDNAAGPNCANNWYIMDSNGVMVTSPLVQDAKGNYYSMENTPNANLGMMRHVNGTYDGIPLTFNQSNNGTFGAITNPDGINALKAKYGVNNISNVTGCYYTSDYVGNTSTSTSSTHYLNYYVSGSKWRTSSSTSPYMTVADYGNGLRYWKDSSTGEIYYPGDEFCFTGSRTTARLNGVFNTTTTYTYTYTNTESKYTVVYLVNGSTYRTDTSNGNKFTVPSCSVNNGMKFLYWGDDYGNEHNPGETFYAPTQYEYMTAVFTSQTDDTYWEDDDGYDIYDYYRDTEGEW